MPFLVLEIANLILAEKDSFESKIIPKCLRSFTFHRYVVKKDHWTINFNFPPLKCRFNGLFLQIRIK